MKYLFASVLSSLMAFSLQAQNFSWAESWGGDSYDHSYSVATDDSGNVYTAGVFQGTVDFDWGPEEYILTSAAADGFVTKTSPTGQLIWAKKIGGSGSDAALAVAIGSNGDVYVSGAFNGTVDFDPGPGTATLTTPSYGYLLRFTSAGNFVWVKQLGGSGKYVTLDKYDNIYTTGSFKDVSDFDPGPSVFNLNGGLFTSVYFCKLNAAGDFVWAKSVGNIPTDSNMIFCQALSVDNNENLYAVGGFDVAVDFDPGPGSTTLTPRNFDAYFLKLDINGDFLWVKHLEQTDTLIPYGDGFTIVNSIALDTNNYIHLTGLYSGIVDFDPGAGVNTFNSGLVVPNSHYYHGSMYIAKYDSDGNYIWAKAINGNYEVAGNDIAVNQEGNIYTTGQFSRTVDFDPGPGTYTLTNYGGGNTGYAHDIFVASYDKNGDFIWAESIGGEMHDRGYSIALDANNNTYITGIFEKLVDFDPGPGVWDLTTVFVMSETYDAFLLKLGECVPARDTLTVSTCHNYTWPINGHTYYQSGKYTHVSSSVSGCDSLSTVDLSIPTFYNVVSYNNGVLTANPNQPADSYQWYTFCSTTEPISGANQSSYTPTENNGYLLVITYNGCSDTSSCIQVENMSITEYNKADIRFFPNPTTDKLNITFTGVNTLSINVFDVRGKLIQQANNLSNGAAINTETWNPGVYFIKTYTDDNKPIRVYQIIKQ